MTGLLGGKWTLDDFDPLEDMPVNGYLTAFHSGNVTEKSLQEMLDYVAAHNVDCRPEKIFDLSEMAKAHEYLGSSRTSAIIVLTLYNQYLLLRNFTTGLREADPVACEAAKGIGMTDMQILTRIRIPLARRAIFAGIRLAIVSTVGIATIASSINAGGLGILLFEGLRTMNIPKILWGSILSAGMAVLLNTVLKMLEER